MELGKDGQEDVVREGVGRLSGRESLWLAIPMELGSYFLGTSFKILGETPLKQVQPICFDEVLRNVVSRRKNQANNPRTSCVRLITPWKGSSNALFSFVYYSSLVIVDSSF